MHEEYLDILDKDGNKTGEQRPKKEAHERGLIHRAAHVWMINSENKLLLQRRASTMRACPNLWDISASGHVSAGQTSLEAAKMETEEELGLSFPDSAFQYLFSTEEHVILNEGTYINNEFQDVYLVRLKTATPKLKIESAEVSEIKWATIEELREMSKDPEKFKLVPHEEEHQKLLEYLKAENK